jgi:hypothetical protein
MIREFDPAIYPIWLCVIVGNSYEEALEECRKNFFNKDGSQLDAFFEKEEYNLACEMLAYKKDGGRYAVVVLSRYADMDTIAHEALHATIDIAEAIGADVRAEEWGCYLIGYISHCIEKTLKEKNKKNGM